MEAVKPDWSDRRVRRFLVDACEEILREAYHTPQPHGGDVFGRSTATTLLYRRGRRIGFFQIDTRSRRLSPGVDQVEYIWLHERERGRGLTGLVLETMAAHCAPARLFLRSPLHPAVAKVADRMGIEHGGPAEIDHLDMFTVVGGCSHAQRMCPDCTARYIRVTASDMVRQNITGDWPKIPTRLPDFLIPLRTRRRA